MKQLFVRLWEWLGRLLGAFATPRYRRETDGLPRSATADGRPVIAPAAPPPPPDAAPPPPALPKRPADDDSLAPTVARDIVGDEPPRFVLNNSLLTFQERKLYLALLRATERRYEVMAKVRLGDIVRLGNNPADAKFHRNQVLCKHVDFVLCTVGMLRPLLVVELDDASHQWPDHAARDQFKNDLFAAVGLPLLRIELQGSYRADDLRDRVATALSGQAERPVTTDPLNTGY
jgi:very-short-patch-repair endonuclease